MEVDNADFINSWLDIVFPYHVLLSYISSKIEYCIIWIVNYCLKDQNLDYYGQQSDQLLHMLVKDGTKGYHSVEVNEVWKENLWTL
jgi:hypothetical protein